MLKLDFGGLHIRKFAGDATDPLISDATMLSTTEICESYRIAVICVQGDIPCIAQVRILGVYLSETIMRKE